MLSSYNYLFPSSLLTYMVSEVFYQFLSPLNKKYFIFVVVISDVASMNPTVSYYLGSFLYAVPIPFKHRRTLETKFAFMKGSKCLTSRFIYNLESISTQEIVCFKLHQIIPSFGSWGKVAQQIQACTEGSSLKKKNLLTAGAHMELTSTHSSPPYSEYCARSP